MKIEKFNPENLKDIRKDIDDALLIVGNKYSIKLRIGNISYNPEINFTCKLEGMLSTGKETKAEKSFEYAELLDLPKNIKDREFTIDGIRMHVVELKPQASKRPCVIQEVGKPGANRYVITTEAVNAALKKEKV